jgi:NAD(P)-dependent dehydrogenase (short-subunit alcohol dehydrogenase family)
MTCKNELDSIHERNMRLFGSERPVVVITGSGAARVGRCIAEVFVRQQFRLAVHTHHCSQAAEQFVESLNRLAPSAILLVGSVDEETSVSHWTQQTLEAFQRVDVLVTSAAIWDPIPLEETGKLDFEKFFAVNSLGMALCNKHFGLTMTKQKLGGAVINISDWATQRPYRDFAAYFLSKGSVETLTRTMAVELACRNPCVRVNALLPGPVLLSDQVSEIRRQRIREECLLKREGTPEDVASAALFLATSPFITGVCLPVDGGRSIYAGPSADSVAHPNASD